MKRSELFFSAISVPLDYVFLVLSAVAAYLIRYLPAVTNIRPVTFNLQFQEYFFLVALFSLLWIVIFAFAGLYNMKASRGVFNEIGKIILACSTSIALVMGVMFFSRYLFDSRFIIISVWILSIIFVGCERIILRATQKYLYRYGIGVHRVLLIGRGESANQLQNVFKNRPKLGFRVVKIVESLFGAKSELEDMAEKDMIDEVILTDPNIERKDVSSIVDFINFYGLDFKYAADLLGTQVGNIDIRTYNSVPVVEVRRTPLDGWGRIIKRIFDLVTSTILIILFSPIMLATAIAIRFDTKGPIFFTYKRVGQKRKKFLFIKFRSMVHGQHKLRYDKEFQKEHENLRQGTPIIKMKNDPRITRVGKVIRRWSIDELPQLFNVFMGSMSLVGPRPHEIEEVAKYEKRHYKLLSVKPGITGMAQVSGRSDLDFEQEVRLDTYYIEKWSLLLDIQILLKTPLAVLRNREAL